MHKLASQIFDTMIAGDVVAFDPQLDSRSKRQSRFDVGQVIITNHPSIIEVLMRRSVTPSEYVMKQKNT